MTKAGWLTAPDPHWLVGVWLERRADFSDCNLALYAFLADGSAFRSGPDRVAWYGAWTSDPNGDLQIVFTSVDPQAAVAAHSLRIAGRQPANPDLLPWYDVDGQHPDESLVLARVTPDHGVWGPCGPHHAGTEELRGTATPPLIHIILDTTSPRESPAATAQASPGTN